MRTTINLDDDVLSLARQQAAALNTSISVVVNRSLRVGLQKTAPRQASQQTLVFGPGEKLTTEEWQRRLAGIENDDLPQHDNR